MGYETEVFLVDGVQLFGKWEPRSAYWYTKNLPKGDDKNFDELPEDAQFSDGGCVVASLKLSKLGYDQPEGTLAWFFSKNATQQKAEKKYITLLWRQKDDPSDEEPIITDNYGEPFVVHDAKKTLAALRETIRLDAEEWNGMEESRARHHYLNRRLQMFEAMLTIFIERFPDCAVITKGY